MQWDHSLAIGIAKPSCSFCHGNGTRFRQNGSETPCNCALRAAFRACLNRFRKCATSTGHVGTVRLELCRGRDGRRIYSFKNEEYMADFCLVSRRALDDFEYKIFRYHYLLGAGWRLCCGRLHMDRGDFFHALYRIEQKLGRTFVELQPYPLYPLNEYFNGVVRKHDCVPAASAFPSTKRFPLPVSA